MNEPLRMFLETFALIFACVVIAGGAAYLVDAVRLFLGKGNDE
ncbi:hypothetical protein [Paraburkholderia susongensis]|uniref:Uncharacterized protein n=1 Tax=Paraburkholderia susongensis TaxID=1515439 RepID=A0A1X7KPD3_9BURK|nr:hypothetical protein [Paraburkholderia susongensis]SMG42975.1 hypothetical protein SAMN06265784_104127 [Paraburkholderia susongensis]